MEVLRTAVASTHGGLSKRCFLSVIHRLHRPTGHETGLVAGQAEPQVSPLRFAPVEMTILLENWRYRAKVLFLIS